MNKSTAPYLTLVLVMAAVFISSAYFAETHAEDSKGAMVLFLTQTDQNVAGHALHIASRMQAEGRKTTVVLIGDAGRLGVKGAMTKKSVVGGQPLQVVVKSFIKAGGTVFITPPTLALIDATTDDLIDGVTPPVDHAGFHDHMFEIETKLVVF